MKRTKTRLLAILLALVLVLTSLPLTAMATPDTGDNWSTLRVEDVTDTLSDEDRKSMFEENMDPAKVSESELPSPDDIVSVIVELDADSLLDVRDRVNSAMSMMDFQRTQAAKDHILKEVKYLLRHILPRKLEGILTFGFEDPATTGQVLGILCVLAVFTGNHLEVNGNFEGKMLEGDVSIKGHVRLCHIAKSAISLLIDKNIRKTIKGFRRLMA